jgi:hypothetical protein
MTEDPPERVFVVEAGERQSDAARFAMADLRLAAWFLWMTPLETALSSLRAASRLAVTAASLSPASAAGLDGLVALVTLLVLLVPLDLGLDVRH